MVEPSALCPLPPYRVPKLDIETSQRRRQGDCIPLIWPLFQAYHVDLLELRGNVLETS